MDGKLCAITGATERDRPRYGAGADRHAGTVRDFLKSFSVNCGLPEIRRAWIGLPGMRVYRP